jgi:drug/metabolite transporter (DMT)-like permease
VSDKHRGWALVTFLIRQPLWLLGWVAAAGGFAFQAVALHYGQLSIVQPLLVTELVFALLLRRFWVHQHIATMAWVAALTTCAALGVFLTAAEPHGGHLQPDVLDWVSALAVFGGAVAVLAVMAGWGSPVRRAALYATAASITWALMAAFIKATTDVLATSGPLGMLAHWPVYALVASGVLGSVLQQAALQSGPLSVSQPLIVVVDPAVAIVLSVWIFDERFTLSVAQKTVAAVAFCVMAMGVTMLSRTAPTDLDRSMPARL